jgi:hypothetical protein
MPENERAEALSSAGAELYCLCQTATADGALSPRELGCLREWLAESGEPELPSPDYVRQVIGHIVESGKVATPDLLTLHRVLEPALPPELRRAPPRATDVDAEGGLGTERLRNEILASTRFPIAECQGERGEPRARRNLHTGAPVLLVRDTRNPRSPNAIAVRAANGREIGYVPEHHALGLAPLLDRNARYRAHLASVRSGARAQVLVVQAHLYAADAELGAPAALAPRLKRPRPAWVLWLLRVAIGAALAALAAFVLRS